MGKPRVNLEDFSDMLHFDTEQEKVVTESPAFIFPVISCRMCG